MFPQVFDNVIQKNYIPSIYEDTPAPCASGVSFGDYLITSGEHGLAAGEAIRLYLRCLPLAAAIDMRAKAFAGLSIKVYNKSDKKFLTDQNHPVLQFLAHPNNAQSKREFMIAYSSFHDITGNSYLKLTAINENSPPLEIFVEDPTAVSIMASTQLGTAGFAGKYAINNSYAGQTDFELDDSSINNRFRYFNHDGDQELWHIRHFNPLSNGNYLFGTSPAQPIWLEIQQYIEGNRTNHSSLLRGVRPSGAFTNTSGTPLTKDQWDRLKEMVKLYTGSTGSGKAFAADGVTFVPTQIPNRDMEFQKLQSDMFERISYRFNIPLPLLSNKASSYNNLSTALFQFYDLSVSPAADKLLEELSVFLMRRYPDSENLELRFDKSEVEALKLRSFEEGKALRAIHVTSDNEIRTVLGFEETTDGDTIWKPSNLIPAGIDSDPTGNDQDPPLPSKFIESMMQVKKSDGTYYTATEAYELAVDEGLIDGV